DPYFVARAHLSKSAKEAALFPNARLVRVARTCPEQSRRALARELARVGTGLRPVQAEQNVGRTVARGTSASRAIRPQWGRKRSKRGFDRSHARFHSGISTV